MTVTGSCLWVVALREKEPAFHRRLFHNIFLSDNSTLSWDSWSSCFHDVYVQSRCRPSVCLLRWCLIVSAADWKLTNRNRGTARCPVSRSNPSGCVCVLLSGWAMLGGGSVLRSRRVVNNVHKAGGARRRIFIPSVVLSVDVVVVLVKHTERQSCRKILMFPHQNQDRNPAHLQLWVGVTLVTHGCGFRWTLLVFGSGAD